MIAIAFPASTEDPIFYVVTIWMQVGLNSLLRRASLMLILRSSQGQVLLAARHAKCKIAAVSRVSLEPSEEQRDNALANQ